MLVQFSLVSPATRIINRALKCKRRLEEGLEPPVEETGSETGSGTERAQSGKGKDTEAA